MMKVRWCVFVHVWLCFLPCCMFMRFAYLCVWVSYLTQRCSLSLRTCNTCSLRHSTCIELYRCLVSLQREDWDVSVGVCVCVEGVPHSWRSGCEKQRSARLCYISSVSPGSPGTADEPRKRSQERHVHTQGVSCHQEGIKSNMLDYNCYVMKAFAGLSS